MYKKFIFNEYVHSRYIYVCCVKKKCIFNEYIVTCHQFLIDFRLISKLAHTVNFYVVTYGEGLM
jgi:hypothetical protein